MDAGINARAEGTQRATVLPPSHVPTAADEANHRIANNLQVLLNLVAAEARETEDAAGRAALERTMNRLGAIASVHRHLHIAETDDRIDLRTYLHELCAHLQASLPHHRTLLVSLDRVEVSAETAASLGMLAVELILNACKHAYPADCPGAVALSLSAAAGQARLTVEDKGCGRPRLTAQHGLGALLIDATVKRLDAIVVWEQASPGTRFSLYLNLYPH